MRTGQRAVKARPFYDNRACARGPVGRALVQGLRSSSAIAAATIALLVAPVGPSRAAPVIFDFVYADAPDSGFNDPTFGASARAVLTAAGDIWGRRLESSYPGETITVSAQFFDGSSICTPGLPCALGAPTFFYAGGSRLLPDTAYPAALANHLVGLDLFPSSSGLDGAEVKIRFQTFSGYSFDTGQPAAGATAYGDLLSSVLHEIGHGLGFLSEIYPDGGFGPDTGSLPSIYDRFVVDEFGIPLATMTDAERLAAVSDADGVFWSGPNGTSANGGLRPLLLANDSGFFSGISVSHSDIFEQSGRTDVLMEECFGAPVSRPLLLCSNLRPFRSIDDVTLGILQDIGWTTTSVTVPEPYSVAVLATCLLGFGLVRYARRRA